MDPVERMNSRRAGNLDSHQTPNIRATNPVYPSSSSQTLCPGDDSYPLRGGHSAHRLVTRITRRLFKPPYSPLHAFHFGFAARITQLLSLRAAEWKDRNVESKTGQFGSLSGGGALATRGMPSGLGQIKASGGGRLIHPTATTRTTYSLMSLLPARRLLGRLLRR